MIIALLLLLSCSFCSPFVSCVSFCFVNLFVIRCLIVVVVVVVTFLLLFVCCLLIYFVCCFVQAIYVGKGVKLKKINRKPHPEGPLGDVFIWTWSSHKKPGKDLSSSLLSSLFSLLLFVVYFFRVTVVCFKVIVLTLSVRSIRAVRMV